MFSCICVLIYVCGNRHVYVCICVCLCVFVQQTSLDCPCCSVVCVCIYLVCIHKQCYFQHGRTPLHDAAWGGHVSTAEYLLNSGHSLDPKDNVSQDIPGASLLVYEQKRRIVRGYKVLCMCTRSYVHQLYAQK